MLQKSTYSIEKCLLVRRTLLRFWDSRIDAVRQRKIDDKFAQLSTAISAFFLHFFEKPWIHIFVRLSQKTFALNRIKLIAFGRECRTMHEFYETVGASGASWACELIFIWMKKPKRNAFGRDGRKISWLRSTWSKHLVWVAQNSADLSWPRQSK